MLTKEDLSQIKKSLDQAIKRLMKRVDHQGEHRELEFEMLMDRLDVIEGKLDHISELLDSKQPIAEILKSREIRH